MTAKDGFFGTDDVDYRKKLVPGSDEAYFLQINKETGDIEVWNEEFGSDKYVGVYKKDDEGNFGDFEENNNWWGGARRDEKEFFKSDKGIKAVKDLAIEAIEKDLVDPDRTDEPQTAAAAAANAEEFVDTNIMPVNPNATPEQAAQQQAAAASQVLSKVNDEAQSIIDSVSKRNKTRQGAGSFGDFSYPKDRSLIQDFMKFTLLEYKPKKLNSDKKYFFVTSAI